MHGTIDLTNSPPLRSSTPYEDPLPSEHSSLLFSNELALDDIDIGPNLPDEIIPETPSFSSMLNKSRPILPQLLISPRKSLSISSPATAPILSSSEQSPVSPNVAQKLVTIEMEMQAHEDAMVSLARQYRDLAPSRFNAIQDRLSQMVKSRLRMDTPSILSPISATVEQLGEAIGRKLTFESPPSFPSPLRTSVSAPPSPRSPSIAQLELPIVLTANSREKFQIPSDEEDDPKTNVELVGFELQNKEKRKPCHGIRG